VLPISASEHPFDDCYLSIVQCHRDLSMLRIGGDSMTQCRVVKRGLLASPGYSQVPPRISGNSAEPRQQIGRVMENPAGYFRGSCRSGGHAMWRGAAMNRRLPVVSISATITSVLDDDSNPGPMQIKKLHLRHGARLRRTGTGTLS
jgi:hypothetical protein